MVKQFIDTQRNPAVIPQYDAWELQKGGVKLSEGLNASFVPFLAVSVLNKSPNNIDVVLNETDNTSFPLTPNSSRSIEGLPIWDVRIKNLDVADIAIDKVAVTILNDMEQTSRYNASIKNQRGF